MPAALPFLSFPLSIMPVLLLLLVVGAYWNPRLVAQAQATNAHIHEYQILYANTERVKKDDLSLLAITASPIHGRGVTLTRPVKKDTSVGVLMYEFVQDRGEELFTEMNIDGYWHARVFITDGGKIDSQRMPVKDALNRCDKLPGCKGITFRDPNKLFADPSGDIPTTPVDVEFKDKSHFGADPQNSWQSYLKNPDSFNSIYYPLACSSEKFLSNPPSKSLDPKLMLPCWPRYVNHSCDPTAVLVKVAVDEGFVLPDIPWKTIVGAFQVVVLHDMDKGSEILLNYEDFPEYLTRKVEGVAECGKRHDEL